MAYDPTKAEFYNAALRLGFSEDAAQLEAGISDAELGSYTFDANGFLVEAGYDNVQNEFAADAGLSPYGEENDPIDPDFVSQPDPALFTEEYVQEQDNPIELPEAQDDGVSPYGEENDPPELPADQLTGVDPYEIDGANIGLTEEEIQQQDNPIGTDQAATLALAQSQAALKNQQRQVNQNDWRVRLTLANGANYLYLDPSAGQQSILYPLKVSNGVVFPYTPRISTNYRANYDQYNLTHSNYRGYFYQNSYVDPVLIEATFTAQDTNEANYVLAVIHFFRSVTKMFYGANDPLRGTPPPLVFLRGLGQYQFNNAPCVVSNFVYNLPNDVDYIRAGSANTAGLQSLAYRRNRGAIPTNIFDSAIERLKNAGLPLGAEGNTTNRINLPDQIQPNVPTFGQDNPTYVPTRLDVSIELLPVQSRDQVSKQFNFADFASGKLITKGFW